ncbi:B12-binding domain/radical SAM domain protein [Methanomicrobium sp. W14]|uniref:methyl-coenzyme M reductase glutamine C-methyltransferase n=1 Tax=Methanomicrobium sp. W14 TaxID=2817839 RepID=UPI00247A5A23|nr:methyl-coenzyme M reductase glutamine C-methyltransferase [Methanomicrobium sp. W14]MBP2133054.1 B12-binding domain/radical SAM domain protein [Methanomicrobium sp. W14]
MSRMKFTVISPEVYTYGAMLVAGILKDNGYEVTLKRRLSAEKKSTVMLSLYSTQHLLSDEIKEFISKHRKNGGTVYIGGPVSAYPEMVLGELKPDAVIAGEGENSVPYVAKLGISSGTPGLAYTGPDGNIIRTKAVAPASMKRPLPLIPDDISSQSIRGASAYIETHRGCTGACTFCQVPRYFGREIRSRDLPDILEEVKEFKKHGATRISVSGGTGSLYQYRNGKINEDAFIELLRGMAKIMGKNNVSSPDIRVDCINERIAQAIREYTIGWVFFGLESGSDKILKVMGKGVSVSQASDAVYRCRDFGLKVAGSFIVGHPLETAEDFEKTKDFITEHCLDDVFVSIAEPIPKTPLAELVLNTPKEKSPLYMPHKGEYMALKLTESEARSFDLQMHADMFKPNLHVVTDEIFNAYLFGVRKDGKEIRAATELLFKYYGK